jgi:predicted DNA-binding protein
MPDDDEAMYEYYADPEHRVPAGPGRRRASKPLSTHVPIRFSPEVIAEVKQLAEKDRKTVSSWIRDVVEAEVDRRRPREPHSFALAAAPPTINWVRASNLMIVCGCEPSTVPDALQVSAACPI